MSASATVASSTDGWVIIGALAAVAAALWGATFGPKTISELWRNVSTRHQFARAVTSQVIYRGNSRMTAVAYGEHGEVLAFGGFSRSLFFHSFTKRRIPTEVVLHTDYVRCLVFSARSPHLYSAGDDGCIFKIDLAALTFAKICQHSVPIYSLALNPEEDVIMCGTKDGRAMLWKTDTVPQQSLGSIPHASSISLFEDYPYPGGSVFSVAFLNDGKSVRIAGAGGKILQIDRDSRKQSLIADLPGTVFSLVSTIGGTLYAGCSNGIIYRCEGATVPHLHEMRGHTDSVRWVVLDEIENRLISSSKDKTVRVWNLETDGHHILSGHTDYVYQLALSPSHHMVASAGGDGTVRLWRI